jgi:hypothetical protein
MDGSLIIFDAAAVKRSDDSGASSGAMWLYPIAIMMKQINGFR